ncbi:hypothetical protein AB6A40_004043 [Gnathostoma spinigerum]|uniref:Uncharacterized protein n=1 Tax=Gnathostoma spinigerum TaxID=75299 RepID=A0ABD6EGS3_9BILA
MNDGIKRLCIGYTKCKQIPPLLPEALPESMNTVTVLDMGEFSGITIGLWEKLINCFTNVEVLNLAGTYMVTEDGKDSALVKIFFGENAFRKIRHFICGIATAIPDDGTGDLFLSALWQWNRPLELLSFSDEIDLCSDISKAPFAASLTVLHLRGPQDKDDFLIISGLINLKELFVEEVIADDKILVETKKLSNLVHLHFKSFREKGCFSDSGFANLFELLEAGGKNRFPSKLKYLKLEGCCGFNERAADALARNCPALESLNIRGINSMGENAVLKIIRGIRELRFLNLSRFDDESQRSAIRSLEDGYLPHLKFLRIHYTKVPEETLRKLLLKRKDLLINTRQGHVLTFTVRNGNPQFDEQFTGNQELLENDLLGQPGYCCLKY